MSNSRAKSEPVLNEVTVIITSSPVPSHPSIRLISQVLKSLKHIRDLRIETPIILAQDGCDDDELQPRYDQYLRKLGKHIQKSTYNLKLVVNNKKGHLTGNLRNVIPLVDTKYILVLQHDLPFVSDFEIYSLIEDMESNSEMKHVRFNFRSNIKAKWDAQSEVFGSQLQGENYRYTRTGAWSDQNHLSTVDYYKTIVLKEVPDGTFMENVLNKKSHDDPEKYGNFIFGELDFPAMIKRINGRSSRRFVVQDVVCNLWTLGVHKTGAVFRRVLRWSRLPLAGAGRPRRN